MSDPYVGEIRMFGGNFAPRNWAFCNGQLLPISENDVLFMLIGTTYGGDGVNTFALPDLQGRAPVHQGTLPGGSTYVLGQKAGAETVTLTTNQIPTHNHGLLYGTGSQASPTGARLGMTPARDYRYSTDTPTSTLHPASVALTGSSQPHENRSPYLALHFIISLVGIFPSQN
ncbi:tail fiber protein [Acidovorax sp. LjRoot118]|uniref:phage tail protein n=1 Tax=Acidovorax sp. LjRoot118 TaxID=3342256 RepID=UPI003ECE0FA7